MLSEFQVITANFIYDVIREVEGEVSKLPTAQLLEKLRRLFQGRLEQYSDQFGFLAQGHRQLKSICASAQGTSRGRQASSC
jgi:hypothetical protein